MERERRTHWAHSTLRAKPGGRAGRACDLEPQKPTPSSASKAHKLCDWLECGSKYRNSLGLSLLIHKMEREQLLSCKLI